MGRTKWVILWTAVFGLIWFIGSGILQDIAVNWAKDTVSSQVKRSGLTLAGAILWLYNNPAWTVSGLVGAYLAGLLSLVYVPTILLKLRSRGIQLLECFVEKTRTFHPEDDPNKILAIGDVAHARIINNGLPADIIPEIRFHDLRNKRLIIDARWSDSPLPRHPDARVEAVTLKSGEKGLLDIAIRFWSAAENWFAIDSNKSPFSVYQHRGYELISPLVAHLIIRGAVEQKVIKREWYFLLVYDGESRVIQINKRVAAKLSRRLGIVAKALAG